MSTVRRARTVREVDYPTSDGKPMGETDFHRQEMFDVIEILEDHFAHDPMTYVSGNLLVFYEEGNRRKHISPDAFIVRGVPKRPPRDYYLLWKEGKTPDLVTGVPGEGRFHQPSRNTRLRQTAFSRVLGGEGGRQAG